MVNYDEYRVVEKNPKTGIATTFDKGYYKNVKTGIYKDRLPFVTPKNRIIETLHREIMCLTAFGLQPAMVYKVLCVFRKNLMDVNKDAMATYIANCCTYYSCHKDDLRRVIKGFESRSMQLIDFYESNKDRTNITEQYDNSSIDINTALTDIRVLIQRLLLFAEYSVPNDIITKQLSEQEKSLKDRISKCEDINMLNELYTELISVLGRKNTTRQNSKNYNNYRAINCLKSSGFVEAAYKWLNCFPNK